MAYKLMYLNHAAQYVDGYQDGFFSDVIAVRDDEAIFGTSIDHRPIYPNYLVVTEEIGSDGTESTIIRDRYGNIAGMVNFGDRRIYDQTDELLKGVGARGETGLHLSRDKAAHLGKSWVAPDRRFSLVPKPAPVRRPKYTVYANIEEIDTSLVSWHFTLKNAGKAYQAADTGNMRRVIDHTGKDVTQEALDALLAATEPR